MPNHFANFILYIAKLDKVQAPDPYTKRPHKFIWAAVFLLSGCAASLGFSPRAQDPEERPYKIESVWFSGGSGVTLAGELTMPMTDGPHKAIVLISGSGPQDRDEFLAGHRPFLVLSDHLTRAGYAVLRYDDRGFADSTGSFADATMFDFAEDAAGAFHYLETRVEVEATAIGFLGHSEGGYIAPAAAKLVDPAFMVFLAGPARPFFDVMATQTADIMRVGGSEKNDIDKIVSQYQEASAILARPVPISQVRQELGEYLQAQGVDQGAQQSLIDFFASPWGVVYATYNPTDALRTFPNPVLALFGEKDLQVSAEQEAPAMRAALSHDRSQVQVLPGLNHLFQPAQTGLPSEYAEIETTISTGVLNQISGWLDSL